MILYEISRFFAWGTFVRLNQFVVTLFTSRIITTIHEISRFFAWGTFAEGITRAQFLPMILSNVGEGILLEMFHL